MLLVTAFFLIPRVVCSFPACKNKLFIPLPSPAWDGSSFSCAGSRLYPILLPTYVLFFSHGVVLLQKIVSISSRKMVVSAKGSLCWTNWKSHCWFQCPDLSWMIWGIIFFFSDRLQSVKKEDHMLCTPTSTHLKHLPSPFFLPVLCAGFARLAHLLKRLPQERAEFNFNSN